MKVKTSLSLSSELVAALDAFVSEGNRSEFIEKALWRYLELLRREVRDKRDMEIFDSAASHLNEEASDVLGYQVSL